MHVRFSKYHGLGNDFVMIDGISQRVSIDQIRPLVPSLCDRHMGLGADGVIVALPSEDADVSMVVINSDGSEPEMCGNGLRCFAKWVYESDILQKEVMSVQTLAGVKVPALIRSHDHITSVEVDMGLPIFEQKRIPTLIDTKDGVLASGKIIVSDQEFTLYTVSMGNPHMVIFVDDLANVELSYWGPELATHSLFPNGVNVEFARVMSPSEVHVSVWERGAGETLACGTGACAVHVVGVLTGRLDRKSRVHLPGGALDIDWATNESPVVMNGPAVHVFDGEFLLS